MGSDMRTQKPRGRICEGTLGFGPTNERNLSLKNTFGISFSEGKEVVCMDYERRCVVFVTLASQK